MNRIENSQVCSTLERQTFDREKETSTPNYSLERCFFNKIKPLIYDEMYRRCSDHDQNCDVGQWYMEKIQDSESSESSLNIVIHGFSKEEVLLKAYRHVDGFDFNNDLSEILSENSESSNLKLVCDMLNESEIAGIVDNLIHFNFFIEPLRLQMIDLIVID